MPPRKHTTTQTPPLLRAPPRLILDYINVVPRYTNDQYNQMGALVGLNTNVAPSSHPWRGRLVTPANLVRPYDRSTRSLCPVHDMRQVITQVHLHGDDDSEPVSSPLIKPMHISRILALAHLNHPSNEPGTWHKVRVRGDGNCGYASLTHALYQTPDSFVPTMTVDVLRALITSSIALHWWQDGGAEVLIHNFDRNDLDGPRKYLERKTAWWANHSPSEPFPGYRSDQWLDTSAEFVEFCNMYFPLGICMIDLNTMTFNLFKSMYRHKKRLTKELVQHLPNVRAYCLIVYIDSNHFEPLYYVPKRQGAMGSGAPGFHFGTGQWWFREDEIDKLKVNKEFHHFLHSIKLKTYKSSAGKSPPPPPPPPAPAPPSPAAEPSAAGPPPLLPPPANILPKGPHPPCIYHNEKNELCGNSAYYGPFCEKHAKQVEGVFVRPSHAPGAGMGLFAARPYKVGDYICDYASQLKPRIDGPTRRNQQGPYVVEEGKYWCDARDPHSGYGRYGNDMGVYSNARIRLVEQGTPPHASNKRFLLRALTNIEKDQEIAVSYSGHPDKDNQWWTSEDPQLTAKREHNLRTADPRAFRLTDTQAMEEIDDREWQQEEERKAKSRKQKRRKDEGEEAYDGKKRKRKKSQRTTCPDRATSSC